MILPTTKALIVEATAGSGKTTTIVDGLSYAKNNQMPAKYKPSDEQLAIWDWIDNEVDMNSEVVVCAFSNAIADELKKRLTFGTATTIHSLGCRIMRENGVKIGRPDNWKTANLYQKYVGAKNLKDLTKLQREILDDVKELVKLCKDNVITEDVVTEELLAVLAMDGEYSFSTSAAACVDAVKYILEVGSQIVYAGPKANAFSRSASLKSTEIDFDDMIYLPVRNGWTIKADMIITDECLPGWTPVMLGSGGSKSIQDVMVGDVVRSFDVTTGKAKNCKVTATQKIANRKPLVKVRVQHNHKTKGNYAGNFVVCTIDHKIWTVNNGWIYAGDLKVGETVIVETAAETTQKGKISAVGCPDGKSCPMPATVISVDKTYISENYVYDITVKDCHNFYANGILVHNCQDLSPAKLKLVANQDCSRYVMVGDPNQAIFAFAGSMTDSFSKIAGAFDKVEVLPLSYTYRCGKTIVAEAQKIVGNAINAGETNPEGEVCHIEAADMDLQIGDMLVSRVNAPLMRIAWKLVKANKPVQVVGRNIGTGLTRLINKLTDKQTVDAVTLCQLVEDWRDHQIKLLQTKKYDTESRQIAIGDQADCICTIATNCKTSAEVLSFIQQIFNDVEKGTIRLSSIHRAKGLEADRVYFYNPRNVPHPLAKTEEAKKQEWNLKFVAVTRAIHKLVYVKVPENINKT